MGWTKQGTITGPAGPAGAAGAASTVAGPAGAASTVAGPAGPRGTLWFQGPGTVTATPPTAPTGGFIAGDSYLDTLNGELFHHNGTKWSDDGHSIKGAVGAVGGVGPAGAAGAGVSIKGTVANAAALPAGAAAGDMYITADGHGHVSDGTAGGWTDVGQIKGDKGDTGAVSTTPGVAGGTGPEGPAGGAGIQGPIGPIGPTGASVTGPAGAPGGDGTDGTNGTDGDRGAKWFTGIVSPPAPITGSLPGDMYLDTASGDVYELS